MPLYYRLIRPLVLAALVASAWPTTAGGSSGGDCGMGGDIDLSNSMFAIPFTCEGVVDGSGEGFGPDASDTYRFRVDSRLRVIVEMDHTPGTALTLCLFDAAGIEQRCEIAGFDGAGRVGWVADNHGEWQLEVRAGLWLTEYSFHARTEPAPPLPEPQDDCATGADADDPFMGEGHAPAHVPDLPADCSGELRVSGDVDGYGMDETDVFSLPMTAGERVSLQLTVPTYAYACIENVGCSALATPEAPRVLLNGTIPRDAPAALMWIAYDWCPCHPPPVTAAWHVETQVLPPDMRRQEQAGALVAGAPFPHEDLASPPGEEGLGGVEHEWIPLARPAGDGTRVTLEWASPGLADLDVLFFEEAPGGVGLGVGLDPRERGPCSTLGAGAESCVPPEGANWALVRARLGALIEYRFTYDYWV